MSQRINQTGYAPGNQNTADPSIGDLVATLARDTQSLVRQEFALARTEVNRSISRLISGIIKAAVAALVVFGAFLVLLFAATAGVHQLDYSWMVSGLIVGGVALLVGLILLFWAKSNLSGASLAPTETIDSLKDDRDWAKGELR